MPDKQKPITVMPLTANGAELELLAKAFSMKDQMIMLPIGQLSPTELQLAFIRAIVGDWIKLVDVLFEQRTPQTPPELMRIFKLTDAGMARLRELRVSAS